MEKCVFIGYPPGYKGWKFYNPVTKRIIISERAEFDERYFLFKGLKGPSVFSLLPEQPAHPERTVVQTLDLEEDDDSVNLQLGDHGIHKSHICSPEIENDHADEGEKQQVLW